MRTISEQELAAKAKKGSHAAFEALVSPHTNALFGFLLLFVRESDASDVLQETILSAWESMAGFSGASSFKTWLFSIAKRRAADFHRKNARHAALPLADFENTLYTPDETESVETKASLGQALEKLTHAEQTLVHLVFEAQLSYAEAAAVLEIPVGTVKSRMAAIRAKLKNLWEAEESV